MEKHAVSIQELRSETEQFLSWVEERKMHGFMGREIDNFRILLEESLEQDSFGETVEFVKKSIRK